MKTAHPINCRSTLVSSAENKKMTHTGNVNMKKVVAALLLAGTCLGPVFAHAENSPFEITVDGQRVDGTTVGSTTPAPPTAEENLPTLDKVDVQVKYDGLTVKPILNVSTIPPRAAYEVGETVRFLASFNYPSYVDHAEIRIYDGSSRSASSIFKVIEVQHNGAAEWTLPADAPEDMDYVLRVYDADGRFDETRPLSISRSSQPLTTHDAAGDAVAPGYGEDATAIRNIDVSGGAVTVTGKHIPFEHDVYVMGEPVPLNGKSDFVIQRILPPGKGTVDIGILKDGKGLTFTRDVVIPEDEWFYVALADFTAGYRFNNEIKDARPGDFEKVYTRGRLAFYLKGKIQGRYILTAAADTDEVKLKHIFKGLDEKNPRDFLRRLDPNDYYPIYGDDSTVEEDAPTRGKFYVRLDRGPSHVMWGNFKSNITGTQFLRSERALYGASAVYRSDSVVPNGEARVAVDAYAALPGTLPERESFRGTGGSAYFLKHQDITQGSETISLEVRNATTGFVTDRRTLKFGADYSVDYVQGVLLLRDPVRSSSIAGTENYVVASYEFSPAAKDVKGYVTGGRAQAWVGDHVRLGVSGLREKTTGANQTVYGADVHVEATPGTYVEAEVARSKGPGFGNSYSPDGGLTIQDNGTAGTTSKAANAWRVEARADLAEVSHGELNGKVQARIEHYQAGFSSLDVEAREKKTLWGVEADTELTKRTKVAAVYSEQDTGSQYVDREGKVKVRQQISEHVAVEPFAQYVEKQRDTTAKKDEGQRFNVGGRLIYTWNDDQEVYVFGQGTVSHSGVYEIDHRAGVGGKFRLTEKTSVSGETSYGTQGYSADVLFNYEPTADNKFYLGYRLDAERDNSSNWPFDLVGSDLGTIVAGTHVRMDDQWAAVAEDNYDLFGARKSLTQTYGVTYTPDATWTFGGGMEIGTVWDNTIDPKTHKKNSNFDRKAASVSVGYKSDTGIEGHAKAEARFENSADDTRDLKSYLLSSDATVKMSKDWRMLGSLDAVFTDATEAVKNSDYMEGSFGFAYRPVDSDRLNALVKYTYLLDEPGGNQVTIEGTTNGDQQRSHIFSADVNYDLMPQLTVGAKYGFRIGETRERTAGANWEKSSAHLAVLRADLHIVDEWDALLVGRALWSPTSNQTDYALLVALYRQVGDNMKIGIGYNFGRFTDDLRDLSMDNSGVFLNVVGKL
jgi:hypothetical protein